MTFKVVESFTRGKKGLGERSEDVIYLGDNYVVVVDGATAKNPGMFASGTPGAVIARVIRDAFGLLAPEVEMLAALRFINQFITNDDRLKSLASLSKVRRDLPSAAIVAFSYAREELWVLGDCLVSVDGVVRDFSKKIDKINANYRSVVNRIALLKGKTVDDLRKRDLGREAIMKVLKDQVKFQNNKKSGDLAYGMLDGTEESLGFATCIDVRNTKEIILASDGYPSLKPTLAEAESELQRVLEEDPLLMYQFIQTKGYSSEQESYDDRSYIRMVRI